MDRIDKSTADIMRELLERIARLERAAPIGFSTVSRGALRITSDEGLIVEGSARFSNLSAPPAGMTVYPVVVNAAGVLYRGTSA